MQQFEHRQIRQSRHCCLNAGVPVIPDYPMFPLGSVFVPGDVVSLRIFEERYVALMRDLLRSNADNMHFGTVLIDRGSEVGGNDTRRDVGVDVRVHYCEASEDGGYLITGVATSRLFVRSWKPDSPYPRADVTIESSKDTPKEMARRVSLVAQEVRSLQYLMLEESTKSESSIINRSNEDLLIRFLPAQLAGALGRAASGVFDANESDDATWVIVRSLPCGPFDRYGLLAAPTLEARLGQVEQVVAHLREMVEFHRQ